MSAGEPTPAREPPKSPAIEPSARWFVRGGLGLVWLSCATGAWAVLARQAPGSPYRVVGFYEPIESLALWSLAIAAVTLALVGFAARGGLFARASDAPSDAEEPRTERWRGPATFGCWALGTTLWCASMAYSGATGMLGVQLRDSGQPGRSALVVRWTGGALLMASLALAQRAIVRGARDPSSDRP